MTTLNNPYQQMAELRRTGRPYLVNVKTTHNGVEMEIENAGVLSHDGDWLVLQPTQLSPDDDIRPTLWLHKKAVAALEIEEL